MTEDLPFRIMCDFERLQGTGLEVEFMPKIENGRLVSYSITICWDLTGDSAGTVKAEGRYLHKVAYSPHRSDYPFYVVEFSDQNLLSDRKKQVEESLKRLFEAYEKLLLDKLGLHP